MACIVGLFNIISLVRIIIILLVTFSLNEWAILDMHYKRLV